MKLKPLGDRVLVKRLAEEEVTSGGIIIPDSAKEKPQRGEIVAVGPGKRDDNGEYIKMDVKKGQQVLFAKYSGTSIKVDGEERLFMSVDDILAIIED